MAPRKQHTDAFNSAAGLTEDNVYKPIAEPAPVARRAPARIVANTDQMSVSEEPSVLTEGEVKLRGGHIVGESDAAPSPARLPRTSAPTNRTRGVEIRQTMSTKDFSATLGRFHRLLTDRARELNAASPVASAPDGSTVKVTGRPSPVAGNDRGDIMAPVNEGLGKLNSAIKEAEDYRYGRNLTGRNPGNVRSSSEANKAYATALGHVVTVHGHLNSALVTQGLGNKSLTTESIHPDELAAMVTHARTLRVEKPSKPFNSVALGRDTTVTPGTPEFKAAKALMEPSAAATEKMTLGERGAPRISKVKQGRRKAEAEQGFVPPASKAERPFRDPRKRSDNTSLPGTGVMAESKPGTIALTANVERPSLGAVAARKGGKSKLEASNAPRTKIVGPMPASKTVSADTYPKKIADYTGTKPAKKEK